MKHCEYDDNALLTLQLLTAIYQNVESELLKCDAVVNKIDITIFLFQNNSNLQHLNDRWCTGFEQTW